MMVESEVLKIVLQGGSFMLLAVGVVWLLFRGAPMLRDAMAGMSAAQDRMVETHKEAVERVASVHKEAVDVLASECREERKEMLLMFAKELEANRVARHAQANDFQKVIVDTFNSKPGGKS